MIKSAAIAAHVLPSDKSSYHAAVRVSPVRPSAIGRHGRQNSHHPIGQERVFSYAAMAFPLPIMKFDKKIAQLSFITEAIKYVKADGAVLEIGVGGGGTSIVINKFMEEESIDRPFYAIDTFYGFTQERCGL